jgi:hypothetical protein
MQTEKINEKMHNDDKNEWSVGRPTKYNEKTMALFYEALADGLPLKGACLKAGVGVTTMNEWRQRYPEIEERAEQARERYRDKALQTINKAIKNDDWRAAQAALKMCFPEYRESTKIDVNAVACASASPVITEAERIKLIERRDKALLENSK